MLPATATFFSTVELVDFLSTFLDQKALSRLSTTSSTLDYVCSPTIWRNVTFKDWQYNEYKEVHAERFKGLAGREHHVRTLDIDADSLILYMNGIGEPVDSLSSPSRPEWMPSQDLQSSFKNISFLPITSLTRLKCGLFPSNYYTPTYIPGVDKYDSSNLVPQLCWLLELNPCLTHLTLTWLELKATFDEVLLLRSIASLNELEHLHVESRHGDERWLASMTALFFCLPMSLVSLVLRSGFSARLEDTLEEEDEDIAPIVETLILREGPLLHLKELELPIHKDMQLSEYGRILEHCPYIDTFSLLPIYPNSVPVIKEVAPLVKRYCRYIRHIKARKEASDWYSWNPVDILDGVHSTLESFLVEYYDQGYDQASEDLVMSSFQRHSTTLRDVRLSSCQRLSNAVIGSILTTCAALERLEICNRANNCAVAKLPEIVAHEWVCTGLKHLELTIDWGQFKDPTPTHLPAYYLQHSSSAPLDQDQEQWNLLERLYGQIGSLVELEVLNLSAYINRMHINQYEPENYRHGIVCGGVFDMSFRSNDRFPLLLSLGVHGGRRGYLDWLSGLRNLKELRGSVHLGNPEVAMTLKQDELEWMVEHWPRLQVLELLPYQDEVPVHVGVGGYEHLNWLLRRKPGLDLRRNWPSRNTSWDGLWTKGELDTLLNTQHG
ncbi:hypothetical protein BGZ47_004061 [Haplosporangium gracile]|nr:hypothetical protein BGZ47_004061 [Haplosporangium gracile]